MLIADKNEIVRLKLLYGPFRGDIIEFASCSNYLPLKNKPSILTLVKNCLGFWEIIILEIDNEPAVIDSDYFPIILGSKKDVLYEWNFIFISDKYVNN